MADAPWKDALRRAKAPVVTPERMLASGPPDAAIDPATVSPTLARLLDERRALEARMEALTGGVGGADPRYAVAPLAQRRAELARWGDLRDADRAAAAGATRRAPPEPRPAVRPTTRPETKPVERLKPVAGPRPTPGESLRGTPGEMLRATPAETVRATPGELAPEQRRAAAAPREPDRSLREQVTPRRDQATPPAKREPEPEPRPKPKPTPKPTPAARLAAAETVGRALGDAGRALRSPQHRVGAGGGDPLDRRLERARDLVGRGRRAYAAAERALGAVREAIPRDWEERARERVPGLGRADPYVRGTARKLSVVVGTIDDLTAKADRMRDMARDARDLRDADAANDDARRDRALDRLKARRAGDGSGGDN